MNNLFYIRKNTYLVSRGQHSSVFTEVCNFSLFFFGCFLLQHLSNKDETSVQQLASSRRSITIIVKHSETSQDFSSPFCLSEVQAPYLLICEEGDKRVCTSRCHVCVTAWDQASFWSSFPSLFNVIYVKVNYKIIKQNNIWN